MRDAFTKEEPRPMMVGRLGGASPTVARWCAHSKDYTSLPILGPIERTALWLLVLAVVAGFALLWGGTWLYGHFRWGWGIG